MLFVVVPVVMALFVVSFTLTSVLRFLLHAGTLAPPYHLNKTTSTTYAVRGGACSDGFVCGFAFVNLGGLSGAAVWGRGAALSFKPYIKLRVIHMLFVVVARTVVSIVVSLMFA